MDDAWAVQQARPDNKGDWLVVGDRDGFVIARNLSWKDATQIVDAHNKIHRMQAVIETYGFALTTIVTADDDEHADHKGCPGSVAAAALETAKNLLSGQVRVNILDLED